MDTQTAQAWLRRWDAQQEHYIADREERFTVIGDVVEQATAGIDHPLVLDLGCGPGSLASRLAGRFPAAEIIGIDVDPVLLALARATVPNSVRIVDTDLTALAGLPVDRPVDAAVSTTALHWLSDEPLGGLYRSLAGLLRPGGTLVNGDHLYDTQPRLAELAKAVREARERRVGVTDNEDWAAWWEAVAADPELTDLATERQRRGLIGGHGNGLGLARHIELLRAAGFAEAGPLWQVGDDTVLVGVR
jgi:SAM-dependent methyltransferase